MIEYRGFLLHKINLGGFERYILGGILMNPVWKPEIKNGYINIEEEQVISYLENISK